MLENKSKIVSSDLPGMPKKIIPKVFHSHRWIDEDAGAALRQVVEVGWEFSCKFTIITIKPSRYEAKATKLCDCNTVLLRCHSRRIEMLLDFFWNLALINIPRRPENLIFTKKESERLEKAPVAHMISSQTFVQVTFPS
jgi:hypothetical protein